MAKLIRIDSELVRRKLAPSRTVAQELIRSGRVYVDKMLVQKPARQINPAQAIVIAESEKEQWASRGAYKLLGALQYLGDRAPAVRGVRALDAGASTGGFTDVLLRKGAQSVVAVDVGRGQLRWRLQQDSRVEILDHTNVRYLTPEMVAPPPTLVVSDLSFISLTLVIPALVRVADPYASFLLMVKPQFEVGKDNVGAGGVVRDPNLHYEAVSRVLKTACGEGLGVQAVAPSPLPGPAGNIEYFVLLKAGVQSDSPGIISFGAIEQEIRRAIEARPEISVKN